MPLRRIVHGRVSSTPLFISSQCMFICDDLRMWLYDEVCNTSSKANKCFWFCRLMSFGNSLKLYSLSVCHLVSNLTSVPVSLCEWHEFPWWLTGKESACQCSRCRFDPRVRKIPWRRKGHLTPVFLPGKSYGQSRLAGYSPWGRKSWTWLSY